MLGNLRPRKEKKNTSGGVPRPRTTFQKRFSIISRPFVPAYEKVTLLWTLFAIPWRVRFFTVPFGESFVTRRIARAFDESLFQYAHRNDNNILQQIARVLGI